MTEITVAPVISRVQALNYRSLRYVDQQLGPFHAIVGPNGTGKSTFLDVIALLGDLVRVGPEAAVLGDSGNRVRTRSTDPRKLTWMGKGETFELAIEIEIPEGLRNGGSYARARYEVGVRVGKEAGPITLDYETLWLLPASAPAAPHRTPELFPAPQNPPSTLHSRNKRNWRTVVNKTPSGNDYFRSEGGKWNNQFTLGPRRSALSNLPADESKFPISIWVRDLLIKGVQRIQLDAEAMRMASSPGLSESYLPDGSNLPWVIDAFRTSAGKSRLQLWVDHVATAIDGLESVDTVLRDDDRHRYIVVRYANGLMAPSWILSDGTLRLLALTLLAYLPNEGNVMLVEEPENGIHPTGVEAVVAALSQVYGSQVLLASHSPVVLSNLRIDQVLCFAKDRYGATDVIRGDAHPRLRKWRERPDLGTLLVAGVL